MKTPQPTWNQTNPNDLICDGHVAFAFHAETLRETFNHPGWSGLHAQALVLGLASWPRHGRCIEGHTIAHFVTGCDGCRDAYNERCGSRSGK